MFELISSHIFYCGEVFIVINSTCKIIYAGRKRRPELTKIIVSSSGLLKADEVAQKAFDGIRHGSFFISCNLEGIALSLATAGLSPQRSFLMAFVEVVAAGIFRIAALCFQRNWYGSIEKWQKEKKCKCLFTF
jgi:3-dehydrosphinganine reductase